MGVGFRRDAQAGEGFYRFDKIARATVNDRRKQLPCLAVLLGVIQGTNHRIFQWKFLEDFTHRHVEQHIQQREQAGHEGVVAILLVTGVHRPAEQFKQMAAVSGKLHQRVWGVVLGQVVGIDEQLQPALQLATTENGDRLREVVDAHAGTYCHRIDQA